MKREEILLKMKAQINTLNRLKKEYTYHESIDFLLKELKNVYNCIKSNGTLSDIEKVCSKHFAAYLEINIPSGTSLKKYIDSISNNVESATDVSKHIVYVDYMCSKGIYV